MNEEMNLSGTRPRVLQLVIFMDDTCFDYSSYKEHSLLRLSIISNYNIGKMSLDCMPILVFFTIASFLDTGHVLSLSQVNRNIRHIFVNDNDFWSRRVRYTLKLTGVPRDMQDHFKVVVEATKTRRCFHCLKMELLPRPSVDPFFGRTLCNDCQRRPEYRLVVSSTAKRNYFLNEYDLLSLRTMTAPNRKYKNGCPIRYYVRHEVQELARKKALKRHITRGEQLRQQMNRSVRAKEAHAKAREQRKRKLFAALGITHDNDFIPIAGTAVDKYIRGGWRDWHRKERWKFEDVVDRYKIQYVNNIIIID